MSTENRHATFKPIWMQNFSDLFTIRRESRDKWKFMLIDNPEWDGGASIRESPIEDDWIGTQCSERNLNMLQTCAYYDILLPSAAINSIS